MIKIRRAAIDDLKSVQHLNDLLFKHDGQFDETVCTGWTYGDSGENYFRSMIENEFVWVAENEADVIGYLAGSYKNKELYSNETYAELNDMYVLEEFRKQGAGKLLFDKFNSECKRKGIKAIRVTASAKNSGAINFYKKNGFDEFDIILRKRIK